MLQTAKRAGKSAAQKGPPHARYLEAFRWMLQTLKKIDSVPAALVEPYR